MTSASRHLSHQLNFAIDVIMMAIVTLYLLHQSSKRQRASGCYYLYGPTLLVVVASLLILMDPIRHVLQDAHLWHAPMYIRRCPIRDMQLPATTCRNDHDCSCLDGQDCFSCYDNQYCSEGRETFGCLSVYGWIFTIGTTYVGFGFFFFAVLWNADIMGKIVKIQHQWQRLRRREPPLPAQG